ncbi:hypothetical protein AB835_09600 [Candidatus Endobugula sertula]|uniref:Uncharacterized protein n=1 Tax=Candidatus Endobugula sertula TaxID=62101 RepID=A0A1D2QP42_9GAMM|nr:hypothetical protein AB835_09600 [Candidatus Endobugula sertula]
MHKGSIIGSWDLALSHSDLALCMITFKIGAEDLYIKKRVSLEFSAKITVFIMTTYDVPTL